MTKDIAADEIDTGPQVLQVEQTVLHCQIIRSDDGCPHLFFGGTAFPSLPNVIFGLELKPGTTEAEAQALADQINQHSLGQWAQFWDRPFEGQPLFEVGENGLAKLR